MPWYLPTRCPIFWDELRRRMRGGRGFLGFLGFGLALTIVLAVVLAVSGTPPSPKDWPAIGRNLWQALVIGQLLLVVLISPALTAGAVCSESELGTLDLLFLTRMGTLELLAGKFLGALGYFLLLLASGMPVVAIVLFFGGTSPLEIIGGYLLILLSGLLYAAFGFLASCLARRAASAMVRAYLFTAAHFIGIPVLVLVGDIIGSFPTDPDTFAFFAHPLFLYASTLENTTNTGTLIGGFLMFPVFSLLTLAVCWVILRRRRGEIREIDGEIFAGKL